MSAEFVIVDHVLVEYLGEGKEVQIPEGVTEIGKAVFQRNEKLQTVTMPSSVVKIGENAFAECTKLKTIELSPNITEIGTEAFRHCKKLKELVLPEKLQTLGYSALAGCDQLTKLVCNAPEYVPTENPFSGYDCKPIPGIADKTGLVILGGILMEYQGNAEKVEIPEGVEKIFWGVFADTTWNHSSCLTEVVLPSTLKVIGGRAFAQCRRLEKINLPDAVEIQTEAFYGCPKLGDDQGFLIHNGVAQAYYRMEDQVVVPHGVRRLANNLFAEIKFDQRPRKLRSVQLPDTLEVIGDGVFEGCEFLEQVTLPEGLRKIGENAFLGCDHLKGLRLPDSVEEIGEGAFEGCRGLADEKGFVIIRQVLHGYFGAERNVVIPEGVVALSNRVFHENSLESVQLPSTLRQLGRGLANSQRLRKLQIPDGVTQLPSGAFEDCAALEEVRLPEGLRELPKGIFIDCSALKKLTIPAGVEKIGKGAFYKCKSLREVDLPERITEIPKSCFLGCTSLKKIRIPEAVTRVGARAFNNCRRLKTVEAERNPGRVYEGNVFAGCERLADANGMVLVDGILWQYEGKSENVTVPEGVEVIWENAFREGNPRDYRVRERYRDTGSLKQVQLPSTLKVIGKNAFDGCKELQAVVLPEGLQRLEDEAFRECEKLKSVRFPSTLKIVGDMAFMACQELEQVELSAGVQHLGDRCFGKCYRLQAITVAADNPVYSHRDGVLLSRAGDTLVYYPGGKMQAKYTIPSDITTLASDALAECESLREIWIPGTVRKLGDRVFPRCLWYSQPSNLTIHADPENDPEVGKEVFDFTGQGDVLTQPELPPAFVKELSAQMALTLGYCQAPEKYTGKYAALYKKFAEARKKSLLKKAQQLKLKKVEDYFAAKENPEAGYRPDLTLKRPSELAKVQILEEVVQQGTLADVEAVLKTYKTFEITARALGVAARYRGLDFVKLLVSHGATFRYANTPSIRGKYDTVFTTAGGQYNTEFSRMLIPDTLKKNYEYSCMYGIALIRVRPELQVLPETERLEILKYLLTQGEKLGVYAGDLLYTALTTGQLTMADALLEMGVDLCLTVPDYYSWSSGNYLTILTELSRSVYWQDYMLSLSDLPGELLLPVLERLHRMVANYGKQLIVSQQMFDAISWTDASLIFALQNMNMEKLNKKATLEKLVQSNAIGALKLVADSGWLSNAKRREELLEFARSGSHQEALAWLMDFKNRTVDVAAEAEKEEKKLMRELMEDPNSVTALKRIWSYRKQEDGTLVITSYKGAELDVEIPAVIGKNAVTAIGAEAFSAWKSNIKNIEVRKNLRSVRIPEGVTEIGEQAFRVCKQLRWVEFSTMLKKIGKNAFCGCSKLQELRNLPATVKMDGNVFSDCEKLYDKEGFLILYEVLLDYQQPTCKKVKMLVIPEGIRKIAAGAMMQKDWGWGTLPVQEIRLPDSLESIGELAFYGISALQKIRIPSSITKIPANCFAASGLREVQLHSGITEIGPGAFAKTKLETVRIPESVTKLGEKAFYGCQQLRDIHIPASVAKVGKNLLGDYGNKGGLLHYNPKGVHVHTPEGSAAYQEAQNYPDIHLLPWEE